MAATVSEGPASGYACPTRISYLRYLDGVQFDGVQLPQILFNGVIGEAGLAAHRPLRVSDGRCRYSRRPPGGAVVAVLVRADQVTVKRLYRKGDLVRLAPANPDYNDIVVPAEEVRVQGRVIRMLHPPRNGNQ